MTCFLIEQNIPGHEELVEQLVLYGRPVLGAVGEDVLVGHVVQAGDGVQVAAVFALVAQESDGLRLGAVGDVGAVAAVDQHLVVGVGAALHLLALAGRGRGRGGVRVGPGLVLCSGKVTIVIILRLSIIKV